MIGIVVAEPIVPVYLDKASMEKLERKHENPNWKETESQSNAILILQRGFPIAYYH